MSASPHAPVTGVGDPDAGDPPEPLRARRRRELREHISSVATRMFLERGFDTVRVVDVARACGVTEKTVFNHFASKESLLADRWEAMIAEAEEVFADPAVRPLDGAVGMIDRELDLLLSPPWPTTLESPLADMRRYSHLMTSTPSLRTYEREQTGALALTAFAALAVRARAQGEPGDDSDDAERWITAKTLAGLWSVFHRSLHRAVGDQGDDDDLARLGERVRGDVHRAADLLRRGL